MKKLNLNTKLRLTNLFSKFQKSINKMSPILLFIALGLTGGLGYVAGTYHYQIEAAIGPVFGYNAHSGSIDLSSLEETYNQLASRYDGSLDAQTLIDGANTGLVAAAGDKYTTYFNPKDAVEFNNSLSGNIGGGIGAEIGLRNDLITIIRPLKNNPAIKAGLLAGDVVTKINDESTSGWSVEKAVGLIRGEKGTTVKLTILRDGATKDYVITRDIINNPSVDSSIVNDVGIITIARFDSETGNLTRAAAQEFKQKNVKGIVLDLRGNSGGYVTAAVDVAGLWLDDKVIMTERKNNVIIDTLKSGSNALLAGIPTVVLVNGGTASASEIVSGALQDYGVAKLVGDVTFGKGSVQEPVQLSNGALLKVTIARWYTPNGKNITEDGITPDESIEMSKDDFNKGIDTQLDAAKKLLE
jgi:carboxyl-terminal processing protease